MLNALSLFNLTSTDSTNKNLIFVLIRLCVVASLYLGSIATICMIEKSKYIDNNILPGDSTKAKYCYVAISFHIGIFISCTYDNFKAKEEQNYSIEQSIFSMSDSILA